MTTNQTQPHAVKYRLDDLEVPADDPFRHDAFDRRETVKFLAQLVQRTGGPFVLAIDSPWGTGKSTLLKMLASVLDVDSVQCVTFNAWKVDYVDDPLVALVAAIDRMQVEQGPHKSAFRKQLVNLRKITTLVAKRAVVATAKVATAGALDVDEIVEDAAKDAIGGAVEDVVKAFEKKVDLLAKFRETLEKCVSNLTELGKKATLVILIDELDRCRPSFAMHLLERVKHLFDVPNIVFVLAIDKRQLEASTAAIYGVGIDAQEYLRRFIDLEYSLGGGDAKRFTRDLLKRFGLDEVFAQRQGELRSDRDNFVDFFSPLADLANLSLRTRERCVARLKVVLEQTSENYYLDAEVVALLIILRAKNNVLFQKLCTGTAHVDDVMTYLAELPNGKAFCEGRGGVFLEAYLGIADWNSNRVEARRRKLSSALENSSTSPEERQRLSRMLEIQRHIGGGMRGGVDLREALRKIDLAARIDR